MALVLLNKYVWIVNLVLIALIAYGVAAVVTGGIKEKLTPSMVEAGAATTNNHSGGYSRRSPRKYFDVIMERNLFGVRSPLGPDNGNPDGGTPPGGPIVDSTLKLELLGTLIKSETVSESSSTQRAYMRSKKSTAIIKNLDTGKVRSYMEGELIDILTTEAVKLYSVKNCDITVERKKGLESLRCIKAINRTRLATRPSNVTIKKARKSTAPARGSAFEGVSLVGENRYEIDRKFLNEMLADPNKLLTQARVVPQDDGLKFLAVRRSSVFYAIGLRNGDILHRINKVEMGNIENALGLFEDLKDQSFFSIDLTRGGNKVSHEYTVK